MTLDFSMGVPGIATGVEDRLVGVPDAVAEKVAAQIVPYVFDWVQLRRVGWKRHEHDILWQDELWRTVPTSTVEDQQGDGTDADAFADFGQMLVHGVDTDDRPADKLLRDCGTRQLSEVFLKASCASRSLCGCTGRTDMLLKFKFLQQLA